MTIAKFLDPRDRRKTEDVSGQGCQPWRQKTAEAQIEASVQAFQFFLNFPMRTEIQPDRFGTEVMSRLAQLGRGTRKMHSAGQRSNRINQALIGIIQKSTGMSRFTVLEQEPLICAFGSELLAGWRTRLLSLDAGEYLTTLQTPAEESLKLPSLVQVIIDKQQLPCADASGHSKTAGSASRLAVDFPAFLVQSADDVDQVLIVEVDGQLVQPLRLQG